MPLPKTADIRCRGVALLAHPGAMETMAIYTFSSVICTSLLSTITNRSIFLLQSANQIILHAPRRGIRVLCKAWHAITPNSFQLLSVAGLWSSDYDGYDHCSSLSSLSSNRFTGSRAFVSPDSRSASVCGNFLPSVKHRGRYVPIHVPTEAMHLRMSASVAMTRFNMSCFLSINSTKRHLAASRSPPSHPSCSSSPTHWCILGTVFLVGGRSSSKSSQACFMVSTW